MEDLWRVATGEKTHKMGTQSELTAIEQAKQLIKSFNIQGASLFDHTPVLRIQVGESEFPRVMELRSTLVEKLKSTGFRFISLDLDDNSAS